MRTGRDEMQETVIFWLTLRQLSDQNRLGSNLSKMWAKDGFALGRRPAPPFYALTPLNGTPAPAHHLESSYG
jgi:hypothetical protein